MMQWNQRLFPYPLLARWTDDYEGIDFRVTLEGTLSRGGYINLGIRFECGSEFLTRLIEQKKAQYALVVSCPATAARTVITSPYAETITGLEAGDYSKELSSIPYIVTTQELRGFASAEHAAEFREAAPNGFAIAQGGILAAGVTVRTPLEAQSDAASVIALVVDSQIPDGEMAVELDNDRIRIALSRESKALVEKLRTKSPQSREMTMLFSSLYLPTVAEAVRKLPESDYAEYRWAVVLRNALSRIGIDADGESLQENAFSHAQKILNNPIGRALVTHADSEDGED